MKRVHMKHTPDAGFTLVELAIVLVIIGLIIGGVLVGQDLIKAAEIRSTTADIERYNAAANTFRNKYSGLPGDIRATRAEQAGMVTRTGAAGHGDGNGLIEGCAAGAATLGCETLLFWTDLTRAQLIADAFNTATDLLADAEATTLDEVAALLPSVPLRDSAFVSIYPANGRNHYLISSITAISVTGVPTLAAAGTRALSALEASQIDEKMDDGAPTTGIVRAIASVDGTTAVPAQDNGMATPDETTCVQTATASGRDIEYYLEVDDVAASLNCSISIRASF